MAGGKTFHLVVASVGETKYDAPATSVQVPGTGGVLTVLANHEPLVTTLKKGIITVSDERGEHTNFEIEDGVLEVSGNRVVVLL